MKPRTAALALVSLFAAMAPLARAAAQEPEAPSRQLHPEAREAISKIRSPFCPGLMLEVCPTVTSQALRDSIDDAARGGLSADSLLEMVVAAHGEEYRAFPKRSGTGLLAWVMPPAALLIGLGLVVLVLRRLKGPQNGGVGGEALTEQEMDRLDAALAEFAETEEAK